MHQDLRPIGTNLIVKPDTAPETSEGGVHLPDAAQSRPQEGTIISAGNEFPMSTFPGDRVVYTRFGGNDFEWEDEQLLLLREDDIIAVVPIHDELPKGASQ